MSIEIKVPPLPESVSDATLVAWHKKVGESVSRDENLVDLETDKVVLEVPAPASGTLEAIKIDDGATVTAGQVLALLAVGGPGTVALRSIGRITPRRRSEYTDTSHRDAAGEHHGEVPAEPCH